MISYLFIFIYRFPQERNFD